MRVVVDRDKCVGMGTCVLTEPDVFDQDDDDGRVQLLTDQLEPHLREQVREATARCPVGAISLVEQ